MKQELRIAIGADHAGFEYKQAIIESLDVAEIKDFGTYSSESADYPDFAHPVALGVESGDFDYGILLCGSANGVAITGTARGTQQTASIEATSAEEPFCVTALVTGLTISTAYWIDVAVASSATSGTASISNVTISAVEQ